MKVNLTPALLQLLFDNLPEAALALSVDGQVWAANSAAVALLGRNPAEPLGQSLWGFVIEEEVDGWRELLCHPDSSRSARRSLRSAAGEGIPVATRVFAAPNSGAGDLRWLLASDQRDRQSLEQELNQLRQQLSEDQQHLALAALAGAAAHELNQPLTAVMGYAELLRRKVPDGTPMAEPLDVILAQAERMAALVRKIGRVSKFETKSYLLGARIMDLDRAGEDE